MAPAGSDSTATDPTALDPTAPDPVEPVGRRAAAAGQRHPARLIGLPALAIALTLVGCQPRQKPTAELQELQQRQEQLDLRLQQLEQRIVELMPANGSTDNDRVPAGPVRSLTFRSGTEDDRLRIYWADGSSSDLPCTREQNTLVCG